MTIQQKKKRNAAIYASYLSGTTKIELADKYNLSWIQVDRIVRAAAKEEHVSR